MVRRRRQHTAGAAERRIRGLAPAAGTLQEAVTAVVAEMMQGVACPPTDLVSLGQKLGVSEISYESFPGSGELHKIGEAYRIVCSSDQSPPRRRFTVAHELAHVILDRTGRNAPRTGGAVERICDMLAAECLMPADEFERRLSAVPTCDDVRRLAAVFATSLRATAIRCAELRRAWVFEAHGDRVVWGHGGVKRGAMRHIAQQVRDGVAAVMAGEAPPRRVHVYGDNIRESHRWFDWITLEQGKALFMLAPYPSRPGDMTYGEDGGEGQWDRSDGS